MGIPSEFRTAPTYESIRDAIGRTVEVDVEQARVQVVVDTFKELCFETTIDFKGGVFYEGEEALVSLRYEKLFGYCKLCFSLCHKDEKCLLEKMNTKKSPERKREIREEHGGWYDGGKYDDRAISYKGVVINGNGNQQNRDRESRDHYGKGKGKMFEEANSKWVKVPEKGSKRTSTYRENSRGDGENSYRRPVHREETRVGGQENQNHISPWRARVQEAQNETREEVCEDGEIKQA